MTSQLTTISVICGLRRHRAGAHASPPIGFWWPSLGYTVFRGVPMLVQLFLWYNIAALYPPSRSASRG